MFFVTNRVVFQKMSPHETVFLEQTHELDIYEITNNDFIQFQIWDFPGDYFSESIPFKNTLDHQDPNNNNNNSLYPPSYQDSSQSYSPANFNFNPNKNNGISLQNSYNQNESIEEQPGSSTPLDSSLSGSIKQQNIIQYNTETITEKELFQNVISLVYVIDAQDEPYQSTLSKLAQILALANQYNQMISVEILIHKVDGDLFLSDEHKIDCHREIQFKLNNELADYNLTEASNIDIRYFLTSIYDHSILEALSKIIQKLIPTLPLLENLLNSLLTTCKFEKVFLFDVVSKVYLATDSSPVDIMTYELCSDMIDVVIDVSCIYGSFAYDEQSSSVIRLSNGMILYLREVTNCLAIVCLIRELPFTRKGIIDYNIDCFRKALLKI